MRPDSSLPYGFPKRSSTLVKWHSSVLRNSLIASDLEGSGFFPGDLILAARPIFFQPGLLGEPGEATEPSTGSASPAAAGGAAGVPPCIGTLLAKSETSPSWEVGMTRDASARGAAERATRGT